MFRTEDIIQKKRDRQALDSTEISSFVDGIATGRVSDAQIAAFTMATWFNGMNVTEQMALTLAMRDSGRVLEWPDLDGPALDKHSTGGVGDLVSLVLAPVIAACGGYVPMISGRGLGHTGGTLDKLESIPGFSTSLEIEKFKGQVKEHGLAITGQSEHLAPADRRIYAVRDVTATVSSPPLMISSILSKKLAEGLDGLVLDIKYGSGAFSASAGDAEHLAVEMSRVAVKAGVNCTALVSNMDSPLAGAAGNALEVLEAVRFLRGDPVGERLRSVTLGLCGELLRAGALADTVEEGEQMAGECISSGAAAEKFDAMVRGQGGPADLLGRAQQILPEAPVVRPVVAVRGGYVRTMDTRAIGNAVVSLGGGRLHPDDEIDPAVGFSDLTTIGSRVEKSEPVAVVHARNEDDWQRAAQVLNEAISVGEEPAPEPPVIHVRIDGAEHEPAG